MRRIVSALARPMGALALAAGICVSVASHAEETISSSEFRQLLEAYVEGAEACTVKSYVRRKDYETPQERRERANQGKKAPLEALKEFFARNSRTVTVSVEPDWVDYDPEREEADIEMPFFTIPSTAVPGTFENKTPVAPCDDDMVRRIPALLCLTRPVFSFDTGTLRLPTTFISVSRKRAQQLDIVDEPGEFFFTFALVSDKSRAYDHWASWNKDIRLHPALRLLSCEWKNDAGIIWRWRGRAKLWIPKRSFSWWYDQTTRAAKKKLLPDVRFVWDISPEATDAFWSWKAQSTSEPSNSRWKSRAFRRKHGN